MTHTVKQQHGMTCPECKRDDQLDVCYSAYTRLTPDGTDDDLAHNHDKEWDRQSPIQCAACNWSGNVGQAMEAYEDQRDNTCSACGAPTDDGEGWDGLCGNCADQLTNAKGVPQ